MSRLLLGIDVGTTGVRAAIVDERGRILAQAAEPCSPHVPAPGRAEADPEDWWSNVRSLVARVGEHVSLGSVEGIGVTGQAPTAIAVDEDGKVLRPALLWLDVRATSEAQALDAALGPGRARRLGGNRLHPYFLGPKIAWLHNHEPQVLERAAAVLQSHAFVVMRITGTARCDPSTAMLSAPLFDVDTCGWSAEGARAVGIDARLLPPLARAHDIVGTVTREAALALGLREGVPVVAGGGDFAASALGAGVVDEGQACLMLGTAGNLLMPLNEPKFDDRLINSHHVGCERWLALGGTLCGAAIEWFRRACAPDADLETLEREAADVEAGAAGVILLPYFRGERTPIWDEHARAVFFGIDLSHGRHHLYRALVEGIALGFRESLVVAEQQGTRFDEIVVVDGAAKSALLRQTLADALGLPLTWIPGSGGTLLGAAALAALGTGIMGSVQMTRAWSSSCNATDGGGAGGSGPRVVRHLPRARARAALLRVAEQRREIYAALKPTFRKAAAFEDRDPEGPL